MTNWGAWALALGAAALADGPVLAGNADGLALAGRAEGVVLAELMGDWNGDFLPDRAQLIGREDAADLRLVLSEGVGRNQEILARGVAWRGLTAGREAGLEPSDAGGLVVTSQNISIGRNRWEQRLTLAYRDGAMRVAGVTRSSYDTIDLTRNECDLNMLIGEGVVNGEPVVIPVIALPVERWTAEASTPEICLQLK